MKNKTGSWLAVLAVALALVFGLPDARAQMSGLEPGIDRDEKESIGLPQPDDDEICDDADEVTDAILTCDVTKISTDLDAVVRMSEQMLLEDFRLPPGSLSREGIRESMRQKIVDGRTWLMEERGEVVFKVDVSAQYAGGAQIEGVFIAGDVDVVILRRVVINDNGTGIRIGVVVFTAVVHPRRRREAGGNEGDRHTPKRHAGEGDRSPPASSQSRIVVNHGSFPP